MANAKNMDIKMDHVNQVSFLILWVVVSMRPFSFLKEYHSSYWISAFFDATDLT